MRTFTHLGLAALLFASVALSGCGGGSKVTTSPAGSATSSGAMSSGAMSSGAMSSGAMPSAMMPRCGANDPAVWVNTKSKVFHMRGDQYFGKTMHGGYMCMAAALAAGDHAAKASSASSAASQPAAEATKKPRHHKGVPAPDAT